MKLPLELLDEIIDQLPVLYLPHPCSLVARSWTRLCQKRMFKVVNIHPGNLEKWLDTISPANHELLGYVRVLCYAEYWAYQMKMIGPAYITLREYLPSFRQLRYFSLSSPYISASPQELDLFSAFQNTLSDISLSSCTVAESTFVILINYFPNLIRLHLRHIGYSKGAEPIPPPSRLHFKKLCVAEWPEDSLDLIDELSNLGLRFEEVVISESVIPGPTWSEFANRVVHAFGANAKCLRLLDTPRDVGLSSSLSQCRELCELEVFALSLNDVELDLVSSITSATIEKIILTHSTAFRLPAGHAYWMQLDDVLIQLVGRLERGLRLGVEFRDVTVTWRGRPDLGEHLPMFVEKGRMMVFDIKDKLIYCSDDVGERR